MKQKVLRELRQLKNSKIYELEYKIIDVCQEQCANVTNRDYNINKSLAKISSLRSQIDKISKAYSTLEELL